ncbi:MAG: chorismate mutase [Bacillota bacterium]
MPLRGVRGAITVPANDAQFIERCTQELLQAAIQRNHIRLEDIAAILFAVTPDLNAAFPASAARKLGMERVALLDFTSPAVEGALERVVRMLLLWNTELSQQEIHHVYLGDAAKLRPDLCEGGFPQ